MYEKISFIISKIDNEIIMLNGNFSGLVEYLNKLVDDCNKLKEAGDKYLSFKKEFINNAAESVDTKNIIFDYNKIPLIFNSEIIKTNANVIDPLVEVIINRCKNITQTLNATSALIKKFSIKLSDDEVCDLVKKFENTNEKYINTINNYSGIYTIALNLKLICNSTHNYYDDSNIIGDTHEI